MLDGFLFFLVLVLVRCCTFCIHDMTGGIPGVSLADCYLLWGSWAGGWCRMTFVSCLTRISGWLIAMTVFFPFV